MNYLIYSSFFFILGLLFFARSLWREALLESYREKIFNIRDRFFLESYDANLDFNSEPYGFVRTLLNGHIRYAENLTLWRIMEYSLFSQLIGEKKLYGETKNDIFNEIQDVSAGVDDEKAKIIESAITELEYTSVNYLMLSSPVLTILLIMTFSVVALTKKISPNKGGVGVSSGKMYIKDGFEHSFVPYAYKEGKLA